MGAHVFRVEIFAGNGLEVVGELALLEGAAVLHEKLADFLPLVVFPIKYLMRLGDFPLLPLGLGGQIPPEALVGTRLPGPLLADLLSSRLFRGGLRCSLRNWLLLVLALLRFLPLVRPNKNNSMTNTRVHTRRDRNAGAGADGCCYFGDVSARDRGRWWRERMDLP